MKLLLPVIQKRGQKLGIAPTMQDRDHKEPVLISDVCDEVFIEAKKAKWP
jgi:hypothetical protein